MKEFFIKHPLVTFLIADILIYDLFTTINNGIKVLAAKNNIQTKEEE